MTRLPFTNADELLIDNERAARRARIAAMMERVAKASERNDPPEERRQVLDVEDLADALATGKTVELTAPADNRLRVAAVLACGLPAALIVAYAAARLITALADMVGAALA